MITIVFGISLEQVAVGQALALLYKSAVMEQLVAQEDVILI